MKFPCLFRGIFLVALLGWVPCAHSLPPVIRSTYFGGQASDAIFYPTHTDFALNQAPLTIEAWVYREDADRCETIVAQSFTNSYWFGFCPRLRFYRSGQVFADADRVVPARQWTHVAASFDGSRVRFYIDGVLAGDKPLGMGATKVAGSLTIGADLSSSSIFVNGYAFKGFLDEIRLWSAARVGSQIQTNRFREIRTGSDLLIAFGDGAFPSTATEAAPVGSPSNSRFRGFGILPDRLVIPRAAFPIALDGHLNLGTEYQGAEQMVIRYTNGVNSEDGVVYLINAGSVRFPVLHLATSTLVYPPGDLAHSGLSLYYNTTAAPSVTRGGPAFHIGVPFAGLPSGTDYLTGGFTLPIARGASTFTEARDFCRTEFDPPCIELRVQASLLGTNGAGRLMLQHYGVPTGSDQKSAPGAALPGSPATWAEVSFADVTNASAANGVLYVRTAVQHSWIPAERRYGQFVSRDVSVYSGDSSASGDLIATFRPGGEDWIQFPYPTGRNITVRFHLLPWDVSDLVHYQAEFGGTRHLIRTNAIGEYVFSTCPAAGSRCTLGFLDLFLLPELGPLAVRSIDASAASIPVVVRENPRKVQGGGRVRIHGTNMHNRIEVYASSCAPARIPECVDSGDAVLLPIVERDFYRNWVDVQVPELPRRWWGTRTRIWVRDRMSEREDFGGEWNSGEGAAGEIVLSPPPFPRLHGFEFINVGNFTSPEEFEATYGESVFTYIPLPPFKVRDPYYYAFWWWIFLALSDASDSGSCHGYAAASQLYFNNLIPLAKYDRGPGGGPAGAHFANGFYGLARDGLRYPFGAPQWSGFDLFKAFEPVNLWAQIRVYMMAQFSEEAIGNTVSQIRASTLLGSDPVEQLGQISGRERSFILCFNPGGIGTGHCVTPYDTVHHMGLDGSASSMVVRSNYSIIKVYDNNWPDEERYMEIWPRSAGGRYKYRVGPRTVWESRSLTRTPLSIFTNARRAPGSSFLRDPDLLYRLVTARGVRAEYSAGGGGKLGWDSAGNLQEGYPGGVAMQPWAVFNTNRETTTLMAFLPATNPPAAINLRIYDTQFAFHAGFGNTVIQIISSNSVPGSLDKASLIAPGGVLRGINYRPQFAHGRLTPMISQTLPGTNRWIFRLDGLGLPAGADVDFLTLGDRRGMRLVNRSGTELTFKLKLDGLDGGTGARHDSVFEAITVPARAAGDLVLGEDLASGSLHMDIDLGLDGRVDRQFRVPAEYVLVIRSTAAGLVAEWRVREGEAALESSPVIVGGAWKKVPGVPKVQGSLRSLELTPGEARGFFRLVR